MAAMNSAAVVEGGAPVVEGGAPLGAARALKTALASAAMNM
jgi:hypothetical protein